MNPHPFFLVIVIVKGNNANYVDESNTSISSAEKCVSYMTH